MEPQPREDNIQTNGSPATNGDYTHRSSFERTARPLPPRPDFPPPRKPRPGFPWAVLFVLFFLAGFFVLLAFLSTGLLMPLAFVGVGIITICALHYLVWGWWLGAVIRREEEEDV